MKPNLATLIGPLALCCALGNCTATHRPSGDVPAWVRVEHAGLDPTATLVGVGSQSGAGPDALTGAQHKALAALAEKIISRVASHATFHDVETTRRNTDGTDEAEMSSRREQTIDVNSGLELAGVAYDIATGSWDGRPTTFARARIQRNTLAGHYVTRGRSDLAAAQRALQLSARPGAGEPAAAIVAALRAQAAVARMADLVPIVAAIGSDSASATGFLDAYGQANGSVAVRVEDIRDRLLIQPQGEPVPVSLAGTAGPMTVRARWGGAPLAGLPLVARSGQAVAPPSPTGPDGLATLTLPPLDGPTLFLAVALDGEATDVGTAVEVALPSREQARFVVEAVDERQLEGRSERVEPSPTRQVLLDLLTRLGFEVGDGQAGSAPAYRLVARTRSLPSSRADTPAGSLHWYRTEVDLVLHQLATGDTISLSLPRHATKSAGRTALQAADAALAQALQAIVDPTSREGLPALLQRRFR